MALGIADFTTQLADLQAQFKAGAITQEQLAEGLRDLWTASENMPALFDQMRQLIDIKATILTALQAALDLRGSVSNVSALPEDAEDGVSYQLLNVADPLDGVLFRRVAGEWVNIGRLRGEPGVGLKGWQTITTNRAAITGDRLICDSSAAGFTVTLPAGGGEVWVRDKAGSFGVHAVTVDGNGRTIGDDATMACDAGGFEVRFTSVGATWTYQIHYTYGGEP